MKNVLSLPRLLLPQKAFGQRQTYRTVSPMFSGKTLSMEMVSQGLRLGL